MMIASTMITPLTTCCVKGETLSRSSPVLSEPMMRAPTIVPQTVPMPPAKLVPPMTAAVIASSSDARHRAAGCRSRFAPATIIPPRPASSPEKV